MDFFYDLIGPLLCFVFCLINSIVEFVRSKKLNKKIVAICDKCGVPVLEGDTHECKKLSEEQLVLLSRFLASLKGGD